MKRKTFLSIVVLFAAIFLSNCATTRKNDFSRYNFSLHNTVSIFLLNNEKGYYFCIPVQYSGDYHIENFEFDRGSILIGDFEMPMQRDELNITVYLNEHLAIKDDLENETNYYYIFLERPLNDNEMQNIIKEYEKGNVNSRLEIWYNLTIDGEQQNGSGMIDDFELHNGPMQESVWFFQNLEFFRTKYLQ